MVLLCVVGQDTRCMSAVSCRRGGSGGTVGLRRQANTREAIQSDDCGPNMYACICFIVCGILGDLTKLCAYPIVMFSGTISDCGKANG